MSSCPDCGGKCENSWHGRNIQEDCEALEADLADARREIRRYQVSLMAHHEISTLSDDAIRESLGGPCLICRRAHAPR